MDVPSFNSAVIGALFAIFLGDRVSTGDTTDVAGWLSTRVGFAVHVPLFSGGYLLGARVHDLNGCVAAP